MEEQEFADQMPKDPMRALEKLKVEIKTLKERYDTVKAQFDKGLIGEEDKKNEYQALLEKEYEYQRLKTRVDMKNGTYVSPKRGDWVIDRNAYGYRRVKVQYDEYCGWG